MTDCLAEGKGGYFLFIFFPLKVRFALDRSPQGVKRQQHRKFLLYFTRYFAMVLSGFFLTSWCLSFTGQKRKKKKKLEHVNYRDHCGELQYHCRRRKGKGNIKHCPEGNSFILQNDWVLFVCFLILWECNYRSHLLLKIYSLLLGQ